MTTLPHYIKDPDAVLDYGFDWSDWLAVGETISASEWSITLAPDAILVIDSESETTTETLVWLSGGTEGQLYGLTNHITTSAGREDDRSLRVRIRER